MATPARASRIRKKPMVLTMQVTNIKPGNPALLYAKPSVKRTQIAPEPELTAYPTTASATFKTNSAPESTNSPNCTNPISPNQ